MKGAALAIAWSVALLAASPAFAQRAGTASAAQKLYDAGQVSYDAKRYDEAITLWNRGYLMSGDAAFLYNIAQAHRLAERCREALDYYTRYAASKGVAKSDVLRKRIADMRRCVDAQDKQRVATGGVSAPTVAAEPAVDRRPSRLRVWLGIGAASLGALGLAAAGYYGLDARDANREIEDLYAAGGTFDGHFASVEARGQRSERRALMLTAAGSAFVIAGAVLYLTRDRARDGATPRSRVSLGPMASGGGVWWSGTY